MSRATGKKQTTATASTAAAAPALLLTQKAEVKEISLKTTAAGSLTLQSLQTYLKKKDTLELIGTYKHRSLTLFLFGFLTGKAGSENKHELPPPHDNVLCFGDILLLASSSPTDWSQPTPFKAADYEAFYTRAFGGFDDLEEEEEEEEAVVEEDLAGEEEELAGEEEEEGDAEEGDEEEEEDEDDEGGEAAEAAVEDEEGGEITAPTRRGGKKAKTAGTAAAVATKTKKSRTRAGAAAAAAATSAAATYSTFHYVSSDSELREQWDEIPYNRSGLPVPRLKMLAAIESLFKGHLSGEEAEKLERCVYNASLRRAEQRHVGKSWSHPPFVELYRMVARSLIANFHPESYVKNTELFQRFREGEVSFEELCGMDSYQMFESHWKDSFVQRHLQEKRQLEGNKAMATDRFTCTRCWKKECTYYEMQTRSADEPMTIFITCLNCGKHWRQ